ncbi:MAG: hypothetical protein LC118_15550 [Dehalococcoidia bacterium]|nr:hypothetical protein [Dehalococcoidia bacterium]
MNANDQRIPNTADRRDDVVDIHGATNDAQGEVAIGVIGNPPITDNSRCTVVGAKVNSGFLLVVQVPGDAADLDVVLTSSLAVGPGEGAAEDDGAGDAEKHRAAEDLAHHEKVLSLSCLCTRGHAAAQSMTLSGG